MASELEFYSWLMTIMLQTLCQHFHTVLGLNENDGMKHVFEKEIHINRNKYYDVLVFYLVSVWTTTNHFKQFHPV